MTSSTVDIDIGTRLAIDRTRLAHERTLMAWVRTAVSMITFGFTIYEFFEFELKDCDGEWLTAFRAVPTVCGEEPQMTTGRSSRSVFCEGIRRESLSPSGASRWVISCLHPEPCSTAMSSLPGWPL